MKLFSISYLLICLYCYVLLSSQSLCAQDEIYYRKLLRGEVTGRISSRKNDFKFVTKSKSYHFDITSDGNQEVITPIKKDGSDWLEISNSSNQKLFETKLQAYGLGAQIYKIQLIQLNQNTKVLILFYLEGVHNYLELHRSARVYFITYEKGHFSYGAYPAAHISIEKKKLKDQYWRRLMQVDVVDLNQSHTKEIIISYLTAQHVFEYLGAGAWKRY